MVELKTLLVRLAYDAAQVERRRAEQLAEEIMQLERPHAEAAVELRLARSANDRLDRFSPETEGQYQCPICWVKGNVRASLVLADSETGAEVFRCLVCRRDFSTEE